MLAICHELISQNWHDAAFLKKYTVGYDAVRAYIFGENDSTPNGRHPSPASPPTKSANWRGASTKTAP